MSFSALRRHPRSARLAGVLAASAVLGSSTRAARADEEALCLDVAYLADDARGGRVSNTPGAEEALWHLHDRLLEAGIPYDHLTSQGLPGALDVPDPAGPVPPGNSLFARIDGSEPARRDQYVLIGAHYDHVAPSSALCDDWDPTDADTTCNGATDNATGAAVVLEIARQLARGAPPARSVVFAFWDLEERDLMGSRHFRDHPLPAPWPQQLVTYVNYDIQGANVLANLRTSTFAVVARSQNDALKSAISAAKLDAGVADASLLVRQLSEALGLYRSDYASFVAPEITHRTLCRCEDSTACAACSPAPSLPRIPTIHFTDSSGPCYHTTQDDLDVVDFDKLDKQARIGTSLARHLADLAEPPVIAPYDTAANAEFGADIAATIDSLRAYLPDLADQISAELGSADPGPLPPPTRDDAVAFLALARAARTEPALDAATRADLDESIRLLNMVVAGRAGCYLSAWLFPFFICPGELRRAAGTYRPQDDGVYVAMAALRTMWVPRATACRGNLTGSAPQCP